MSQKIYKKTKNDFNSLIYKENIIQKNMRYLKTFESFEGGQTPSAESLASNPEFQKACDAMKSFIESEVLPNLTPEELKKFKAQATEAVNKMGVSGADTSEVAATMIQKIQDKTGAPDVATAVMSLSDETNEGVVDWFKNLLGSPKTKRFLAQVATVLGITVMVGGIIAMSAQGYEGWSDSPFLIQVRDLTDSLFGNAAGPISTIMFFAGALSAFGTGVVASNIGDEIRRDRARGAREAF